MVLGAVLGVVLGWRGVIIGVERSGVRSGVMGREDWCLRQRGVV